MFRSTNHYNYLRSFRSNSKYFKISLFNTLTYQLYLYRLENITSIANLYAMVKWLDEPPSMLKSFVRKDM